MAERTCKWRKELIHGGKNSYLGRVQQILTMKIMKATKKCKIIVGFELITTKNGICDVNKYLS